jgi:hypothetical protein
MKMHVYVQTVDKIKYSHYRINSVFFLLTTARSSRIVVDLYTSKICGSFVGKSILSILTRILFGKKYFIKKRKKKSFLHLPKFLIVQLAIQYYSFNLNMFGS